MRKHTLFFVICLSYIAVYTSNIFASSFYAGFRTGYDVIINKYNWNESTNDFSLIQENLITITTTESSYLRGTAMAFGSDNSLYLANRTGFDIIIDKYNFDEQIGNFSLLQANITTISTSYNGYTRGTAMAFSHDGSFLYVGNRDGQDVIIDKYNWNESTGDFSLIQENLITINTAKTSYTRGTAIAFGQDNTLYIGNKDGYDIVIDKYNFDEETSDFSLIQSNIATIPSTYINYARGISMDFKYNITNTIPEPASIILILSVCGAFLLKRKFN